MSLFKKVMRDPVDGTAKVITADGSPVMLGVTSGSCEMDLYIDAAGVESQMMHLRVHVKVDRWPQAGEMLPIRIDRADPSHVDILWDQVPTQAQKNAARRAQQVARAQQAPAPNQTHSAANVLAVGVAARVMISQMQPAGIGNPQGEPVYMFALTVTVPTQPTYRVMVGNPVPAAAAHLAVVGADLPAKILPDDHQAVVIDWQSALTENHR